MKIYPALVLLTALTSSLAHSACTLPATPAVPDGAVATKEALVASSQAVKAYMDTANAYLQCLDQEEAATVENDTPEAKQARTQSYTQNYNDAVTAMETVAASFNQARTAFLAQNSKPAN